jgi:hypothetical protein
MDESAKRFVAATKEFLRLARRGALVLRSVQDMIEERASCAVIVSNP